MNSVLEKILIELIKRFITEEMIYTAKVAIVEFLSDLAKKSDNKLDDAMVGIIAEALGVPYEMKNPKAELVVEPHNNS